MLKDAPVPTQGELRQQPRRVGMMINSARGTIGGLAALQLPAAATLNQVFANAGTTSVPAYDAYEVVRESVPAARSRHVIAGTVMGATLSLFGHGCAGPNLVPQQIKPIYEMSITAGIGNCYPMPESYLYRERADTCIAAGKIFSAMFEGQPPIDPMSKGCYTWTHAVVSCGSQRATFGADYFGLFQKRAYTYCSRKRGKPSGEVVASERAEITCDLPNGNRTVFLTTAK